MLQSSAGWCKWRKCKEPGCSSLAFGRGIEGGGGEIEGEEKNLEEELVYAHGGEHIAVAHHDDALGEILAQHWVHH